MIFFEKTLIPDLKERLKICFEEFYNFSRGQQSKHSYIECERDNISENNIYVFSKIPEFNIFFAKDNTCYFPRDWVKEDISFDANDTFKWEFNVRELPFNNCKLHKIVEYE